MLEMFYIIFVVVLSIIFFNRSYRMIHFMALASVAVGLFAFAFGDYGDEELEV